MSHLDVIHGVEVPDVGVMEMLRFEKFTVGWGWTSAATRARPIIAASINVSCSS